MSPKRGHFTVFDLEDLLRRRVKEKPQFNYIIVNDRFNEPYKLSEKDIQREDVVLTILEDYLGAVEDEIEREEEGIEDYEKLYVLGKLRSKIKYNIQLIEEGELDQIPDEVEKDVEDEIETDPNMFVESVREPGKPTIIEINV